MDPNAALARARTALSKHRDLMEKSEQEEYVDTGDLLNICEDLAQAFGALDEWLSGGGFKPHDWA